MKKYCKYYHKILYSKAQKIAEKSDNFQYHHEIC